MNIQNTYNKRIISKFNVFVQPLIQFRKDSMQNNDTFSYSISLPDLITLISFLISLNFHLMELLNDLLPPTNASLINPRAFSTNSPTSSEFTYCCRICLHTVHIPKNELIFFYHSYSIPQEFLIVVVNPFCNTFG